MVTVENIESLTVVYLLHLGEKIASSCTCGFHKTTYNQTESKIKSPTNTAGRVVWNKNSKVMVEAYAGVPDVVQSRK